MTEHNHILCTLRISKQFKQKHQTTVNYINVMTSFYSYVL